MGSKIFPKDDFKRLCWQIFPQLLCQYPKPAPQPTASFPRAHGPLGAAVFTHYLPLGSWTSSAHINFCVLSWAKDYPDCCPPKPQEITSAQFKALSSRWPEQKMAIWGHCRLKSRYVKELDIKRMGRLVEQKLMVPHQRPLSSHHSQALWPDGLLIQVSRALPEVFLSLASRVS